MDDASGHGAKVQGGGYRGWRRNLNVAERMVRKVRVKLLVGVGVQRVYLSLKGAAEVHRVDVRFVGAAGAVVVRVEHERLRVIEGNVRTAGIHKSRKRERAPPGNFLAHVVDGDKLSIPCVRPHVN